jgi:transcription elongation factor GreB
MASDYVSMDSPLGKSLLGKRLDDEIAVTLPAGTQTFTVVAISYAAAPAGPDAGDSGAPD